MNKIRRKLISNTAASGLIVQELRQDLAFRVMAEAGFDSVIIDMEHGTFSLEQAAHIAHLCNLLDMTPLIRTIDTSYASIARALDAGAAGVVLPRIRHADEVRQAVQFAKYPPIGDRGMSGQRGQAQYLPVRDRNSYARQANDDTLVVVQIEQCEAVENVQEIIAVPGVDIILVGPTDLSMSMGGKEYSHPDMQDAIHRVVAAGKAGGVTTGMAISDVEKLRNWRQNGMGYLVNGSDVAILTSAITSSAQRLSEAILP